MTQARISETRNNADSVKKTGHEHYKKIDYPERACWIACRSVGFRL
jgi:hypothetical protein